MVKFCPECSSLLRKKIIDGKAILFCRCGYQEEHETNNDELEQQKRKKKQALEKNLIVISEEDKISVHPIITKICPKCKHAEAESWQVQTRSADEPSTTFFRCVKCKHTWREY
ncbi:MAG: transcription factor S [Promethearchaeota archaeon]|nr:MAG: transcription factor S [Candidatus Lokiarchaeota archaeon]